MAFWIPRRKPRMVQASTATSVPVSTVYSWPVLVKVLFWPFTATRKLDLENADAMGFSTEKSRDPLSTQLRASFQPPCVECHVLGRESVANPTRWFLRNHPILDPTRWGKTILLFTERWWFWMAFLHRLNLVGIYQFTCWYLWLSHLGSSLASWGGFSGFSGGFSGDGSTFWGYVWPTSCVARVQNDVGNSASQFFHGLFRIVTTWWGYWWRWWH